MLWTEISVGIILLVACYRVWKDLMHKCMTVNSLTPNKIFKIIELNKLYMHIVHTKTLFS